MSILAQDRPATRHHLNVKCRCGRGLRARPEQAGSRITCWDCRAEVKVPVPVAPGDWVARLLRMGARQVLEARTFTLIAVGAVLVTLAMAMPALIGTRAAGWLARVVPNAGVWVAALALALVMTGYGELLRRGSQGDWTARPAIGLGERAWRTLVCSLAGVALALPLLLASASRTPPRTTLGGLAVAAGLIAVFPLVMLATYAARGPVRGRAGMVGATLVRHPVAVVATLLLLPISILAIELALVTMTRIHGSFSFLALDLFPRNPLYQPIFGIPYIGTHDYRLFPERVMTEVYGGGLRGGYSLIGAIPPSLALGTSNGFNTWAVHMGEAGYFRLRMALTVFIVTTMLASLAVQARWLGLLSTMDTRRSGAAPVAVEPALAVTPARASLPKPGSPAP